MSGFDGDDDDVEGNKLAIAEPVKKEADDDMFIPAAIECEPDDKPIYNSWP